MKIKSSQNIFENILKTNDRIFIHSCAAAPQELIRSLCQYARENKQLSAMKIYQIHTEGIAPYADEEFRNQFEVNAFFVGPNVRKAIQSGQGHYIPIFLSEIPDLFNNKVIPLDICLIQVSPPDQNGFCTLGVSVDVTLAAARNAKIIVAQINKEMPRVHGDGIIHISQIHYAIEKDEPICEAHYSTPTDIEVQIGKHIAPLIKDGACLQMGIGNIPNAVLSELIHHKNLSIHTEMFSNGIIPLVEKGIITNLNKKVYPGKIVSGFIMGDQNLYRFVHDNPIIQLTDSKYVNDTSVIRKNPNVVAINSAIEIDLTGQVCADSLGRKIYSGVGGQMDFIRGASLSPGGIPIIAMPSLTSKGQSKIVCSLNEGAGVVTTRAHVHYVVTEFGVANLYGKNLKERAQELIKIAHPSKRSELEESWAKCYFKS